MVCVFPGWAEVLARDFLFITALMREDFPTLDFPAKAISGLPVSGSLLVIPQTISSETFLITIFPTSHFRQVPVPALHSYFPQNANTQGADVVIHSLHKTLPSLTQTALLHINGRYADRERIRNYLHMLQSSSPSYILMASIDECVRGMDECREEIMDTLSLIHI